MIDRLDDSIRSTFQAQLDATRSRLDYATVSPQRPADTQPDRRTPRTGLIAAAVFVVVAGFVGWRFTSSDESQFVTADEPNTSDTTTPTSPTSPTTPASTTSNTSDSSTTLDIKVQEIERDAARWFQVTPDGLTDDSGQNYLDSVDYSPLLARRLPNGDIYFTSNGDLWSLPISASVPVRLIEGIDAVQLTSDVEGNLVWIDTSNTWHTLDGGPVTDVDAERSIFVASNGLGVRLTLPKEPPDQGWVQRPLGPAVIEVVASDQTVVRGMGLGFAAASQVWLSDFDGRHLLVSRAPAEPALGPVETFWIDLTCADGCVTSTVAVGPSLLNGADTPTLPDISIEVPDICAAAGAPDFTPPTVPDELSPAARQSFEFLVMAAGSCDPFALQAAGTTIDWTDVYLTLDTAPEQTPDGWLLENPDSYVSILLHESGIYEVTFISQ